LKDTRCLPLPGDPCDQTKDRADGGENTLLPTARRIRDALSKQPTLSQADHAPQAEDQRQGPGPPRVLHQTGEGGGGGLPGAVHHSAGAKRSKARPGQGAIRPAAAFGLVPLPPWRVRIGGDVAGLAYDGIRYARERAGGVGQDHRPASNRTGSRPAACCRREANSRDEPPATSSRGSCAGAKKLSRKQRPQTVPPRRQWPSRRESRSAPATHPDGPSVRRRWRQHTRRASADDEPHSQEMRASCVRRRCFN